MRTRYMGEASKVSSGFRYFFLIFAPSIGVRCGIWFCIEWSEFQWDRLGKTKGFESKYYVFHLVLLICLVKIYLSTFIYHLISAVRCGVKICIKWSEFSKSRFEKIRGFQSCSTSMSRKNLLLDLWGLSSWYVECRIKFLIQHRSMERISERNTRSRCSLYWLHTCTSFSWWVLEICRISS
jgi:hypothetical protein